MRSLHRVFQLCLFISLVSGSASAQSWLDVSPTAVYLPPGDPSCYTISVGDAPYMVVDLEGTFPWGPDIIYGVPLDFFGQATLCTDGSTSTGDYFFTGVRNSNEPWWGFTATWIQLTILPPPPWIDASGPGCDNGDCVWLTGARFYEDSRVVVYSADWSVSETYYGPAWQMSPSLSVSQDNQWLAFQLVNPDLRYAFGWDGVHVMVVNADGTSSAWRLVQSPPPTVSSATPSCADLYCITFAGVFPLNASVDFRIPGESEVLLNAFTDLSVTSTQMTLRLEPGVRHAFDTTGLNAVPVNPGLPNWGADVYLAPVDRAVIGYVDGVDGGGQQYYLAGWACAKTQPTSIDLHVYVGGPSGGGGQMLFSGTANVSSEPAVASACNSTGTNYRFYVPIPHSVTQNYGGQPVYVYGISPIGLSNNVIGNSGNVTIPGVDRSITGWISGISVQGQDFYLNGWACAKTYSGSIDVDVYVGGASGAGGTYAFSGTANQSSEPAIAAACNSTGSNYRFSLQFPSSVLQQDAGKRIYVHGISPYGLSNLTLNASGTYLVPGGVPNSLKEFIYLNGRVIAVETTAP